MTVDLAAGRLLVASPGTSTDMFGRSVVLLLNHHPEEGAHGVILNKPLQAPVGVVLPDWQEHVTHPGTLFTGGPVGADSALGVVSVPGGTDEAELLGVQLLFGGLGLVDLDVPPPVVASELGGMRVFVGYAGWEAGQLEREIRAGGWALVEADARDAFTDSPQTLWRDVLLRQRSHLSYLVTWPQDADAN